MLFFTSLGDLSDLISMKDSQATHARHTSKTSTSVHYKNLYLGTLKESYMKYLQLPWKVVLFSNIEGLLFLRAPGRSHFVERELSGSIMVCMWFLVSIRSCFIFSGYLMSIIKRDGSWECKILKEAGRVMYFVCEFGLLFVELVKKPLQNVVALGLDYWWISWPTKTYFGTCDHWK